MRRWRNGVGYYVLTRLLWDATQDARAIERELYEQAFGHAAEPMQRVYRRWESKRGREEVDLAATYRDLAEATRKSPPPSRCIRRCLASRRVVAIGLERRLVRQSPNVS